MSTRRQREQGSAIFVTTLILAMFAVVGLAALQTVQGDLQVAGVMNRERVAFYAAESGITRAITNLEQTGAATLAAGTLGDATIYPHGQPSYQLDPTVTDPVEDLGAAGVSGMNLSIGAGGPSYQIHYYRLRVQGQAPGGTSSRVEVVVGLAEAA